MKRLKECKKKLEDVWGRYTGLSNGVKRSTECAKEKISTKISPMNNKPFQSYFNIQMTFASYLLDLPVADSFRYSFRYSGDYSRPIFTFSCQFKSILIHVLSRISTHIDVEPNSPVYV